MMGLKIATSFPDRVRGLLKDDSDVEEILLMPCRDIHTFGMRDPIDVAFLDKGGHVVKVARNVVPGKRLRCSIARAVLERRACDTGKWYEEGQRIEIVGLQQERR